MQRVNRGHLKKNDLMVHQMMSQHVKELKALSPKLDMELKVRGVLHCVSCMLDCLPLNQ